MALIACPECTRQVSDKAASCPHCGNPLAKLENNPEVTTIEATGKSWKFVQLAGVILIVIGLVAVFSEVVAGLPLGVVGVVLYIVGRMGAWWQHG